jgi:hypothetical protein
MSDTITGVVEAIDVRETNAGTMYNIKVNGKSFGYGRYPPKAKAGDTITFGVKYNGQYANVDTKNVQVTPGSGAPPQKSFTSAPSNDAGKNAYWENKEKADAAKQVTIERQAALNSAIAFANVIVGANLVPTPANAKPKDVVAIIESMVLHYRDVFLATSTEKSATATAPTAEEDSADEEATGW